MGGGQTLTEITVYVCDQCGYFRSDWKTGKHTADNPDNPRGRLLVHELKPVRFVRADEEASP